MWEREKSNMMIESKVLMEQVQAWYSIARTERKAKNYLQSYLAFQKVIKLEPKFNTGFVHLQLAEVALKLHYIEISLDALKVAEKSEYTF